MIKKEQFFYCRFHLSRRYALLGEDKLRLVEAGNTKKFQTLIPDK